jgi:hypothetical protein
MLKIKSNIIINTNYNQVKKKIIKKIIKKKLKKISIKTNQNIIIIRIITKKIIWKNFKKKI